MTEVPKQIVEVAQQLKDGQVPRRYKVLRLDTKTEGKFSGFLRGH